MVPPSPRSGFLLAPLLLGSCMLSPFSIDDSEEDPADAIADPDRDGDGDGFSEAEGDCDDEDPSFHPQAEESLNGVDDDCDGQIDEGPDRIDADADGYTASEGDCDDENPGVHPDARDGCDAFDNDCDGEMNEDDLDLDPYESIDGFPWDFQDLTDDQATASGFLTSPSDIDLFAFSVTDEGQITDILSDGFRIEATLSGVPSGHDYLLELWKGNSLLALSDDPGDETLALTGLPIVDDGGEFQILVASHGDVVCETPYLLVIRMDNG